MLNFFLKPYPEETLYSCIARYHKISGNIDAKYTLKELFGKDTINPNTFLNTNLDYLCEQLPESLNYTVKSFLENNSLYQLYKPFIYYNQINDNGYYILFSSASEIKANIDNNETDFKICPICMKEDVKKYGQAYFHRIHQVSGNFICEIHEANLINVNNELKQFIDIDNLKDNFNQSEIHCSKEFLRLADNIKKILIYNQLGNYNILQIIFKYRQMLKQKGFCSFNGMIHQKKLISAFKMYYTEEFLEDLKSNIDINANKNWIRTMLSNNKKTMIHPIRHLLFIQFLFGGIDEFTSYKYKDLKPYGFPNWPCLNPCCPEYKKNVITSCKIISSSDKAFKGIFCCPVCGMKYLRCGSDKSSKDRYRGKIIEYGHLWDEKFLSSIERNINSMRKLSSIMCCNRREIKKQALRLNVLDQFNTNKNSSMNKDEAVKKIQSGETQINIYKQSILNLLNSNSNLIREDIKKLLPKECKILIKKDRGWYEQYMPRPMNNKHKMERYNKKYWEQKDKEFVNKILEVIKKTLCEIPPIRITKNYIGGKVHYSSISQPKYLSKMPLTQELLNKYCETIQQFNNRKRKLLTIKSEDKW